MFRHLIVGLQLAAFLSSCEALTCVRCEGDPDMCAKSQTVENCDAFGSDQVCNNFYYWNAGKAMVRKGCYQRSACETQQKRPDNECGEHAGMNKPCRCCCNKNRCNSLKKGCIVPSKCGKPRQPRRGRYHCPVQTRLGSVCNFTCPADYDMVGARKTTCIRSGSTGKLVWSPLRQACRKIRCKKIFAPENGDMSCVNKGRYENQPGDNFLKTECTFKCSKGYKIVGAQKTVCKADQTWSKKVPSCVIDPCDPIPKSPNRIDTCTDGFTNGSVCRFKCEKGYKIVGEEATECVGEKGVKEWDRKAPKCTRPKCQVLKKPKNAFPPSCSDAIWLGSVCEIKCLPTYSPTHTDPLVCASDGTDADKTESWNKDPPSCEKNECGPLGLVRNGKFEYSNDFKVGSVANLTCNDGYTYKHYEASECLPKGDDREEPAWSKLSYVNNLCCVTCIFNKKLRIVSVVDKTAAQNTKQWEDIVTWHYFLLDYLYTRDYDIKFGMVLYDDTVDSTNSISEKRLASLDDVEDIQYAIYDFPHGGKGSDTAGALDYAMSTYFRQYTSTTTSRRPKEEPYIIVIKSPGSAEDAAEVAQRLLGERIHILALGFKKGNFKAEEKDLTVITGDAERVAMMDGIPDVIKVSETITEISKSHGCSATSRNQLCT